MYRIFKILITAHPKALFSMFFVAFFASFGVLAIQELVVNVEQSVARETRPLLGGDIAIEARNSFTGSLREAIESKLSDVESLKFSEKVNLETTLFDREGKTGLVKLVIVDPVYPLRSVFEITTFSWASDPRSGLAVTPNVIERFASGGQISLDGVLLPITAVIQETSELGISFGDEGYLLVVPKSLTKDLSFLERGARYERTLLIQSPSDALTDRLYESIRWPKWSPQDERFRVNSYRTNASRVNEAIAEFGRYTLLVLLCSVVFAAVTLANGYTIFLQKIIPFMRTAGMLGLTRLRKALPLLATILAILIAAFCVTLWLGLALMDLATEIPGASEFRFEWSPVWYAIGVLGVLFFSVIFPKTLSFIAEGPDGKIQHAYWIRGIGIVAAFLGVFGFLSFIFDLVRSVSIVVGGILLLSIILYILGWIYRVSFGKLLWKYFSRGDTRMHLFTWYDGIRSIIRPGSPAVLMTLFLLIAGGVMGIFFAITLTFTERLSVDRDSSTNIYAINILETDEQKVRSTFPEADVFSILRARVVRINDRSLADHIGTPTPGGEFRREFSITTNPLKDVPLLEGKSEIGEKEVSVEEWFAKRLRVKIGDRIVFSLSGREFELTIVNIRESAKTTGFQPFFYFQVSPTGFAGAPKTFFMADRVDDIEQFKIAMIWATGPHVSFVDVGKIVLLVQEVANKLLQALLVFFIFLGVYAVLASLSLLEQMKESITIKKKLYTYLGALSDVVRRSTWITLGLILTSSATIIILMIGVGYWGIISLMPFLSFSYTALWYGIGSSMILLSGLWIWCIARFR